MLYEDDVIDHLRKHLEKNHYSIKELHHAHERGVDIIAEKDGRYMFIEAKGQTSSKNTRRKGKEFTTNQKKSHVSVAIYKTLKTKKEYPDSNVAIALPADNVHKKLISNVQPSLARLGIIVFFVDERGCVDIEAFR